jgi:Transposase DDE domain
MKKRKTRYRVRNWPECDAALMSRGSLTLWVDEEALRAWRYSGPPHRGAQYACAEAAIQRVWTPRVVYHLALRATAGLAHSLFDLLKVSLPVPSYSTLSRRGAAVEGVPRALRRAEPVHLVIDSSGFKVYGEGGWEVRVHGWSKRRTWRKRHVAVDEATGEIVAAVASEAGVSAEEALPDLLGQVGGRSAKSARTGPMTSARALRR